MSIERQEIKEFIQSYNINVVEDYEIDGTLIDLFLPSINLAIEYDDLYFHSSGSSITDTEARLMLLKKTEMCEKNGIHLLHIFENEWLLKKDLWKSVLIQKLGKSERIFARKCQIVNVQASTTNEFLTKNHLQGNCPSQARYGLMYHDELISLIAAGDARYSKKSAKTEILRYCSKAGTTIVGGFSRLINVVENYHHGPIVSYANRRWSTGNVYKKTGFDLLQISGPCYYYYKVNEFKFFHRSAFMKHKLEKQLKTYDPLLSEVENMYENGYRRIWDCGNLVFIKDQK